MAPLTDEWTDELHGDGEFPEIELEMDDMTEYAIRVNPDQWRGIECALELAEEACKAVIARRERSVSFWRRVGDADVLALAERNLREQQTLLTQIRSAMPAVIAARFPSAAPTLSSELAHEAAATASLGGKRGTTPSTDSDSEGALECRNSVVARVLTSHESY